MFFIYKKLPQNYEKLLKALKNYLKLLRAFSIFTKLLGGFETFQDFEMYSKHFWSL